MSVCRRPDLALWYTPRLAKQQARKEYSLRLPTTVLAIMAAYWDAAVQATIAVLTIALLLLGILIAMNGLVALLSNWQILLPSKP